MTTIIKTKCLACSLHFMICTEHVDTWEDRDIICPECGSAAPKLRWYEESKEFIFNIVPGKTELAGLK